MIRHVAMRSAGNRCLALVRRAVQSVAKDLGISFFAVATVTDSPEMITRAEAELITVRYMASMAEHCDNSGIKCALVNDAVIEEDFGWVFFYDSADVPMAGNAPMIVERETGRVLVTGTALPIQAYIDKYKATGDPHGHLETKLRLVGFHEGAKTITAMIAIRSHLGINLKDAKDMVESCIKGESIVLHTKSETAPAALESESKDAQFITERSSDENGPTE